MRVVVPTIDLTGCVREMLEQFIPDRVIVGNGTGSAATAKLLREIMAAWNPDRTLHVVEESYTSEEARKRAIRDERPTGWRKFIPRALRSPVCAYDDIVAEILAERWLKDHAEGLPNSPS